LVGLGDLEDLQILNVPADLLEQKQEAEKKEQGEKAKGQMEASAL